MASSKQRAYEVFSHGLFGNKHKLQVLLAIRDLTADGTPDVYPRQVSKRLPDAADNQVANVMDQLASAGVLIRLHDKRDDRRNYYRVRELALWSVLDQLEQELDFSPWAAELGEDPPRP